VFGCPKNSFASGIAACRQPGFPGSPRRCPGPGPVGAWRGGLGAKLAFAGLDPPQQVGEAEEQVCEQGQDQ
jgi:hypothetical protein